MKRKPVGSDHDKWLHAMLRQEPAKASEVCLDADTIASWAGGSLTGKELAAAELHASTCSRCMAILAATERSAPPATGVSKQPWILVTPMRWLVPLTAAATAVAIWIAVPDRPVVAPTIGSTDSPQMTSAVPERTPDVPPAAEPKPAESYAPVPPAGEPQSQEFKLRVEDESRRERAGTEAEQFAKREDAAAPSPQAPMPPPAAAESALAAPPAAPAAAPAQARDSAADPQPMARSASRAFAASESVSSSNALSRWRIVAGVSVERSTDGGKTWMRTSPLPDDTPGASAITGVNIRAVDASRAVVSTSDGRVFYTTDAGKSWTRVQENQTVPF